MSIGHIVYSNFYFTQAHLLFPSIINSLHWKLLSHVIILWHFSSTRLNLNVLCVDQQNYLPNVCYRGEWSVGVLTFLDHYSIVYRKASSCPCSFVLIEKSQISHLFQVPIEKNFTNKIIVLGKWMTFQNFTSTHTDKEVLTIRIYFSGTYFYKQKRGKVR